MPLPALALAATLAIAAEVSRRASDDALLKEAAERAGQILRAPVSYEVRREGQDKILVKFTLEGGSGSDLPVGLFVAKLEEASLRRGPTPEDRALRRSISSKYAQDWEQAGRPAVWRMMFAVWERGDLIGKGIGMLVYRWFVEQVSKQGGFLAPDEFYEWGSTSDEAMRVWDRLRSRPQMQTRGWMIRLREGDKNREGSSLAKPFAGMTSAQRHKVSGAVLYEGPSRINGEPIAAVMVYDSGNKKTGDIPQVWLFQPGVHPYQARVGGSDVAVCGGCILAKNRGCYVQWTTLKAVTESYSKGNYGDIDHARWWFRRNSPNAVRIGAYGDPVAVPLEVWERLAELPPRPTILGYTQMWRSPLAKGYQKFCMASTKSPQEYADAKRLGWRSYRVALPQDTTLAQGQQWCPETLSDEDTCKGCRMCSGGVDGPDIMVELHGAGATMKRATESLRKLRVAGQKKGGANHEGQLNGKPWADLAEDLKEIGHGVLGEHILASSLKTCSTTAPAVMQYLLEKGHIVAPGGEGRPSGYVNHYDLAVLTSDRGWLNVDPTYMQFHCRHQPSDEDDWSDLVDLKRYLQEAWLNPLAVYRIDPLPWPTTRRPRVSAEAPMMGGSWSEYWAKNKRFAASSVDKARKLLNGESSKRGRFNPYATLIASGLP